MHPETRGPISEPTAAKERHWRWGLDRPIALLREEPEQLEQLGVRFEEDSDDLDDVRQARVATPTGRVFALVRYKRSPQPGTEIVTRHDSPDLVGDLNEVLRVLRLKDEDIVWEHPAVASARLAGDVEKRLRPALWRTTALVTVLQLVALSLMVRGRLDPGAYAFTTALVVQAVAVLASILSVPLLIRVAEHLSRRLQNNRSETKPRDVAS
jgi:hypothetical protein